MKDELKEKLKHYATMKDMEEAHKYADDALLKYINDEEVTMLYERINRWYA